MGCEWLDYSIRHLCNCFPTYWVLGFLLQGKSCLDIKNEWSYTSCFPYNPSWRTERNLLFSFFYDLIKSSMPEDNSNALIQYSCGSQPPGSALMHQETERSVRELMTGFWTRLWHNNDSLLQYNNDMEASVECNLSRAADVRNHGQTDLCNRAILLTSQSFCTVVSCYPPKAKNTSHGYRDMNLSPAMTLQSATETLRHPHSFVLLVCLVEFL